MVIGTNSKHVRVGIFLVPHQISTSKFIINWLQKFQMNTNKKWMMYDLSLKKSFIEIFFVEVAHLASPTRFSQSHISPYQDVFINTSYVRYLRFELD